MCDTFCWKYCNTKINDCEKLKDQLKNSFEAKKFSVNQSI